MVGKLDRTFMDGGMSWVFLWKSWRGPIHGCVEGDLSRGKSGLVHQVTGHPEAEGERFNAVDMLPLEGYFKIPLETTRENAEQSQQARLINFH